MKTLKKPETVSLTITVNNNPIKVTANRRGIQYAPRVREYFDCNFCKNLSCKGDEQCANMKAHLIKKLSVESYYAYCENYKV
jgi:hypothetical protein